MNTHTQQRGIQTWAISLVAVAFGLLTIKEGGTILFGGEAARAAAGNYVPFVLWFNFLAGFAYVVAGIGLWLQATLGSGAGHYHRDSNRIYLCGFRGACAFRRRLRAAHGRSP